MLRTEPSPSPDGVAAAVVVESVPASVPASVAFVVAAVVAAVVESCVLSPHPAKLAAAIATVSDSAINLLNFLINSIPPLKFKSAYRLSYENMPLYDFSRKRCSFGLLD